MKRIIIFFIMLSVSLVACVDKEVVDYGLDDNYSTNAEVSFTAQIDQREGDSEKVFVEGDSIAIFGLIYNGNAPESLDINNTYISNSVYTLNGSSFSRTYPQRFLGEKMDFIAYTPYLSKITSCKPEFTVASDQSTSYKRYDVLYAKKSTCSAADILAPFEFSHLFSKIEFTLTKGASISTLEGITIRVKNLVNTVELDMSDGTLTPKTSVEYMIPYKSTIEKYQMIVVPQNISAQTELLEFALNGETVIWKTATPINLKTSTLIKVNVTVESNYVDVTITGNIDGWEEDKDPINGIIN